MKILIIDDQELVLLTLEKYLIDLGYLVKKANNMADGIAMYDEFQPDLVITDVDMPVVANSSFEFKSLDYIKKKSGLEIIKHIRVLKKETTPVMVLSGNRQLDVISQALSLGAADYVIKPVRLDIISMRVENLIGKVDTDKKNTKKERYIHESCVGVIIPCYYSLETMLSEEFIKFVNTNLNYHLCFVNYSYEEMPTKILNKFCKGKRISVLNFDHVVHKTEAIRLGMLHLEKEHQFEFIGFLNEDLSVNFDTFKELVNIISTSNYKNVVGLEVGSSNSTFWGFPIKHFVNKKINGFYKKFSEKHSKEKNRFIEVFDNDIVKDIFKNKFLLENKFEEEISNRTKCFFGDDKWNDRVCVKLLKLA
ncbi:response regulator [Flavobacterium glaciei]|uniref:Glycosyl transferase family 2 n=1 Tax=Flavobacterium glaciei TaxID=386300 RepID=A0A562PJT0_9FLAO|nr:response regulator [Flavobacterium glaciei]RDI50355.1 glycosyl transferase family 2 [Flavobacterium glaciei]TWI44638.1 glycosyl transferase family 2 [Flavobacterium glaciei]